MKYTALYASVFALFYLALAYNVVRHRWRARVVIGDGGDAALIRAIRVHANAAEYVPLALLLLAMYEFNGGLTMLVHVFGISLLIARVLHLVGLGKSSGRSRGRYYGTLITWIVIVAVSIGNILNPLLG